MDAHPNITALGTSVEVFYDDGNQGFEEDPSPGQDEKGAKEASLPHDGGDRLMGDAKAATQSRQDGDQLVGNVEVASQSHTSGAKEACGHVSVTAGGQSTLAESLCSKEGRGSDGAVLGGRVEGGSWVASHPTCEGTVRWSLPFYCCVAHPSVIMRRDKMQKVLHVLSRHLCRDSQHTNNAIERAPLQQFCPCFLFCLVSCSCFMLLNTL